jgi:hypothetical protein
VTSPAATRAELWAAAALTAFGIAATIEAARTLSFGSVTRPAPGFFPLCTALALALVSGGVLLRSFRRSPATPTTPSAPRRIHAAATLIALLVYALVIERLGFGLATFLLIAFLFRAIEPRSWPVALGGAAATAVACHVLFRVWLGVRLPPGPWGF